MTQQLDSLRRYMAQRRPTALPPTPRGVLVLGAGKGGVGTSTVAALLAMGLAAGRRVLLVDADFALSALPLLLDVPRGPGLGALRGGELDPRALLTSVTDSLSLLCAGGADDELAPAERQALFRRVVPLFSTFDLTVVDGGSRLDSVLAACGGGATRVITVSTADRVAVAATYALIKVLAQRVPATPVDVVVNRSDAAAGERTAEEIGSAAHHFLQRTPGYGGNVPDDQCLHAGVAAGMSLPDAATDSPAAAALHQIGNRVLHQLAAGSSALAERHQLRRS